MSELEIIRPEVIDDTPFPGSENYDTVSENSNNKSVITQDRIKDQPLPKKRVATELISSALNTQSRSIIAEFEFIQQGAIQIGEYVSGVSGDIRISPNGITGRNNAGNTTFSIDGATGDATFAGTIQAGAVISGEVIVGNNNVVIDVVENGGGRILIKDPGTGLDAILIGYLENGF